MSPTLTAILDGKPAAFDGEGVSTRALTASAKANKVDKVFFIEIKTFSFPNVGRVFVV
jgi:hypothetical protein